jgi:hypothetical protein
MLDGGNEVPDLGIKLPGMLKPGIYFGLDDELYHAAFALSASGIKSMRVSTYDFWVSCRALNPRWVDEETAARILGRAFHKRICEGKAAFEKAFAAELRVQDHPDALRTVDDIKAELSSRGERTGGNKAELARRLRSLDPSVRLWDEMVADHKAKNPAKHLLEPEWVAKIEIAAAMVEKHPLLSKCFSGGYPEVSIFWLDPQTGVPMKARIDYLKPKAIVDLKSFSNPMNKPFDVAVRHAIATNLYYVQAAFYWEAVAQAIKLISAGDVFGETTDAFLNAIVAADESQRQFVFVAQSTGDAPVARGYIMGRGTVFGRGEALIREATELFAKCWRMYGKAPWVDTNDIAMLDDTQFPAWIGEG